MTSQLVYGDTGPFLHLSAAGTRQHPLVRYETAHGNPHRDILHPNGEQTKNGFEGYSVADILTIGQRDIMGIWPVY